MFRHDTVPSHSSLLIRDFFANHETTLLPQPPYAPDLAPVDFILLPKLKLTLNVRHFGSFEEIRKKKSLSELRAIPQNVFSQCFQNCMKKRWEVCIMSGGNYFEGDKPE